MSKLFTTQINIKINAENNNNSKHIEIKSFELFQIMDSYGNYTDINWFRTLNKVSLIKFLNELYDIWNYRSQINDKIKKEICYHMVIHLIIIVITYIHLILYHFKKLLYLLLNNL